MVAMGRKRIWVVLVFLVILFLAFAWYDEGREPLRLIEQPAELPEQMG